MKSPKDMKVIQIEITNACHMRCANCTRFCGHHVEPFFMDFDTFKKAIDSLKGFQGIIGIMGGEPTIHPEFERFVEYYREHVGYDDFSTVAYHPSSDFMRHILAKAWHVDYSNRRGLWTSVTPRYYKHFELIQDVFGYQLLNDHSNASLHQTHMVTRKELGIPDDKWIKLRDRCWVQNLWSASITPKGAFFCEIAAAMDATLDGPGGWPIESDWWKREPKDFGDQLQWCEMCSACLPMPSRDARDETDDVSPVWARKLQEIKSPKLSKGLINVLDVTAYSEDNHSVINEVTPYMDDQESRLGKTRERLVPRHIKNVIWLSDELSLSQAREILLSSMASRNKPDAVASEIQEVEAVANEFNLDFVTGKKALQDLIVKSDVKDWVILVKNMMIPDKIMELVEQCVFNPGVLYDFEKLNMPIKFFSIRASALRKGEDLFGLEKYYPERKIVSIKFTAAGDYLLSDTDMFLQRLGKRINWIMRKIKGLPVGRGPIGELKGNRVIE